MYSGRDPEGRVSKSISSSRLSQMLPSEPIDEVATKTKGLKGLLMKIKPKGTSKSSLPIVRADRTASADEDQYSNIVLPQQMPSHSDYDGMTRDRDRGNAMPSKQIVLSGTTAERHGSFPRDLSSAPSAQGAASSSRYQNPDATISDTSYPAAQRESYASSLVQDKTQSRTRWSGSTDRRGPEMEMLSVGRLNTSPEASSVFDEPVAIPHGAAAAAPTHAKYHLATHPPVTLQPQVQPTSSLSASSFVETPPPALGNAAPFFDQRKPRDEVIKIGRSSLPPNRLKSLPPLPPVSPDDAAPSDSLAAVFRNQTDSALPGQNYDRQPNQPERHLPESPNPGFIQRHRNDQASYQPLRTSLDPAGDRSSLRQGAIQPRMAQSLYLQPEGAGSTGNFGRFMAIVGKRQENGTRVDFSDGRSLKSQNGFKGLLSRGGKVV